MPEQSYGELELRGAIVCDLTDTLLYIKYSDVLGGTFASQHVPYSLPADAKAEHNRLNVQHYMLKTLVGG